MARRPGVVTRERRLQGISAYLDQPAALAAEFAAGETIQRVRTFSQAAPDDLVAALDLLGQVEGAAIVVHGPRGCGAALVSSASAANWAVTGLDQRDTIMGSDGPVERAVLALVRRHKPWAVFVVTTPVVAINSDDARDTVLSLTDELGIPVQLVRTDGFRSRIAATGYDAATQALLTLVPPVAGARRDNLVNLLARDNAAAKAAADLLAGLGLEVNVLPGAGAESFARAGQARLSISLDPDATGALAAGLEAAHGVPVLSAGPPIGLAATQRWLGAIGTVMAGEGPPSTPLPEPAREGVTGNPSPKADHGAQPAGAAALPGISVYLALPPDAGLATAVLIGELGGTLTGLTVEHIDSSHAEALDAFRQAHPGVRLHVAAGQPFELANLFASQRPDVFVGTPELAALAAAAGIPAVGVAPAALIGWHGATRLAQRVRDALRNPAFVRRLATAPSPYPPGWLRRSADWHVKQEVR